MLEAPKWEKVGLDGFRAKIAGAELFVWPHTTRCSDPCWLWWLLRKDSTQWGGTRMIGKETSLSEATLAAAAMARRLDTRA